MKYSICSRSVLHTERSQIGVIGALIGVLHNEAISGRNNFFSTVSEKEYLQPLALNKIFLVFFNISSLRLLA